MIWDSLISKPMTNLVLSAVQMPFRVIYINICVNDCLFKFVFLFQVY